MSERERLRREKLSSMMASENLDGYLITDSVNASYLTGFNGEDSYLWIGDSSPVLLSDSRFTEQIKEEVDDVDAVVRRSGESTINLLKGVVSDKKYSASLPKRIGFESASTTFELYQTLTSAFPNVEFVSRKYDVERIREIKDEGEIELIKAAIHTTIDAYKEIRSIIMEDVSESDFRDELEYRMRKLGGDDVSFPSIVAFDERAALPHAIPKRERSYKDASLVLVDWGAKKNNYVGDLTRTFLTEKGNKQKAFREQFEKVFDVVLKAHDKAIENMRPGVPCREIDKIARDVIAEFGYGEYFGHGLGHGIGRVVHDYGGLSPKADGVLTPNMILTVEPGVYLPGWGGVRIEDDVLITENGVEILSKRLACNE